MAWTFKFSLGPWNIHEGADPFGPEVRKTIDFNAKLAFYKKLGIDGVQFHDDYAVPNMDRMSPSQIIKEAGELKQVLDNHGLMAEFVAARDYESINYYILDAILK